MSRIISGKLRLDVRTVDLLYTVNAAADSIRPAADAKSIRLQILLDPAAEPISGDADRLQQIVWNLLTNAVKFTPKPDVLISDLGMPDEDGYSLIAKIRELPPEQGGQIPAAALTAYARAEDRMRVLRSGFQFHLPKPVDSAELVTVVASLAGRAYKA